MDNPRQEDLMRQRLANVNGAHAFGAKFTSALLRHSPDIGPEQLAALKSNLIDMLRVLGHEKMAQDLTETP